MINKDECVICLDELHSNTCKTNCHHTFHSKCLNDHINYCLDHNTKLACPICRSNMKSYGNCNDEFSIIIDTTSLEEPELEQDCLRTTFIFVAGLAISVVVVSLIF